MIFNAGDRVKCVDATGGMAPFGLVEGADYTVKVAEAGQSGITLLYFDGPSDGGWDASRFVPVTSRRLDMDLPKGSAKTTSTNPKDLIGITKVQVGLFPSAGTIEGARAMEDGAKKYGAYNWREHPVKMTIYLDAAERHLMALRDGEDNAEDSGVSHLGHILSCAAILADAAACGNLIDDRPTKGRASELFARYKKVSL